MIYLVAKAAHIVSLFVWISGITAVALSLKFSARSFMKKLKAYDRIVTTPAMILAWCFGLYLANQGEWFSQAWLAAKILFVIVLSGLHGVLIGELRRISDINEEPEPSQSYSLLIIFILVAAIVFLVTLKPSPLI